MPKRMYIFVILAGFMSFIGCATTVKPVATTVKPVKTNVTAEKISTQTVVKDMNTVAIFPLADYSKEQSFLCNPRYGINLKVMEAITDGLVSRGITVLNQEDVTGFLISEGIIAVMNKNVEDVSNPQWELMNNPHEKVQQANLVHMMAQDTTGDFSDNKVLDGVKVGLSKGKVKEIGNTLGADKIIRGQIIEYGFNETKSLNPINGWLAVLVGGLAEGSGAFVYQQGYEKGLPDSSGISKYVYSNDMGSGPGANIPPKLSNCYVQIQ